MTVFNLRTVEACVDDAQLKPLFVRSSAPFFGGDNTTALTRFGVRSIIDLRDAQERAVTDTWDGQFKVHHIPIFQNRLADIHWRSFSQLYVIMATDFAKQVARAVQQVAVCLREGPVLVHCTAGKDRTGVVVAFVLAYVGARGPEILRDYLQSTNELGGQYLAALARLGGRDSVPGLAAHIATHTDPQALAAAFSVVRDAGGISKYLTTNGASPAELGALTDRLVQTRAVDSE